MTVYEHTVPTGLWILALLAAVVAAGISAWRFLPRNAGNAVLGLLHLAVLALCLLGSMHGLAIYTLFLRT